MKSNDLIKLGELYKELRLARGLRLKDVARDNLSVSQLSKFENGQNMLAADKLLIAISGIHMTLAEFGHILNNYAVNSFFELGNTTAELQSTFDIEGLKKLLKSYADDEIFTVYNRLNKITIKSAIYSLDPHFKLENSEKEFLTEYLYGIEAWTEYELYIFGNCLFILSNEDLIFLGKEFIKRSQLYTNLAGHRKVTHITFLNIIMTLLERRQLYYVNFFIEKLEAMVNYQDMLTIVSLNFFKKVSTYLETNDLNDKEKIDDYVKLIEQLENPHFSQILHKTLSDILVVQE